MSLRCFVAPLALIALTATAAFAQAPAIKPVEKKDAALDGLLAPDAKLELVKSGFGFTEGVTWVPKGKGGYLIFSDIPANVIYRLSPDGKPEVHVEKSGYQKPDLWRVGMPLIGLNSELYAREAELRFALVRTNESAESIALCGGEQDERRQLDNKLEDVIGTMGLLSGALSRLTWITSGYGWVAIVVPIIVASPGYFSGGLSTDQIAGE